MRIFFVRHGESTANVERIFSNRLHPHPLSELGREQVARLAEQLRDRGIVAVYSSPIPRAVESAEILSRALNVSNEISSALAEFDVGIYEGRPLDDGWREYVELEKSWMTGDLDAKISGGESCNEVRLRFKPFIHQLIEKFRDRADASLLLVGHGGTFRHALPCVLSNVSSQFAMAHGLGNVEYVEAELRDSGLHCVRWGHEVMD